MAEVGDDYNYSPSVIQSGNRQQIWWCASAWNPTNPTQLSDAIWYQSIDTTTGVVDGPNVALAETKGAWDSAYTCNPRVVGGVFSNPLGDGQTYSYEMFYVATAADGVDNSIGAAFSNDGLHWNKYPQPVILSTSPSGYGVGQPAAYNRDGKSAITMFYEDNTPFIRHIKASSTDGIHFTVEGVLTTAGLDLVDPNWGDIGFDRTTKQWYAVFNLDTRASATTGGEIEPGQYGFQLYRIPDAALTTGGTGWQLLQTVDTNLTGYESNFIPGLLHDANGNIDIGQYPSIQIFPSISDPAPAWNASPQEAGESGNIYQWVIGSYLWVPNQGPRALDRYRNASTYEVTTGWLDPDAGFSLDTALGHLYETPRNGATLPFYGCKNGAIDYFVSLDPACEGARILGLEGYGYTEAADAVGTGSTSAPMPLYRCTLPGPVHSVSNDALCEGQGGGTFLGYAAP